jgi:hypothetical protein
LKSDAPEGKTVPVPLVASTVKKNHVLSMIYIDCKNRCKSKYHTISVENTEWVIKNGQSRETGNIGYTRRRKTKQKHNIICIGHHYA